MNRIKHLWNITKYLGKLEGKEANDLRMSYIQRCKEIGAEMELPKQNFGPGNMCQHCGSIWTNIEHQIRVNSGQTCSKSIQKIINENAKGQKQSRYRTTLAKKCLKNKNNTLTIKCSVCSKNTEVSCKKPKKIIRQKKRIQIDPNPPQLIHKKKKKKSKDKTAGLNVSLLNLNKSSTELQTSVTSSNSTEKIKTEIKQNMSTKNNLKVPDITKDLNISTVTNNAEKDQSNQSTMSASTPVEKIKPELKRLNPSSKKPKKINVNKLNNILKDKKVQKNRQSLSNFLQELC